MTLPLDFHYNPVIGATNQLSYHPSVLNPMNKAIFVKPFPMLKTVGSTSSLHLESLPPSANIDILRRPVLHELQGLWVKMINATNQRENHILWGYSLKFSPEK